MIACLAVCRNRFQIAMLLLLLLLPTTGSASPLPNDGVESGSANAELATAFRDVKIVVGPGQVIEKGTVVIRDGLIQAVGADVAVPYDSREIDGNGLVVYAGFFDSSTDKGLPTGEDSGRVSGSGQDRGEIDLATQIVAATREVNRKGIFPDYSAARFIKVTEADAEAWRKHGFTTVHVLPSGELLNGTSSVVNLVNPLKRTTRDSILVSDFAMAGGWSTSRGGYPSSLMGVVAHLRQNLLDAQHYQRSWEIYRNVERGIARPPFDPAMESLGAVLRGAQPVIFPASNLDDLFRARNLSQEFGFELILDGNQVGNEYTDDLKQLQTPLLLAIDFPDKPELGKNMPARPSRGGFGFFGGRGGGDDDPDKRIPIAAGILEDQLANWEQQVKNPAVLAENGIQFILTTRGHSDLDDFLAHLRLAMEHGLAADEALASLTTRPAALFGLANQLGTVEVGKIANLTVMSDLLEKEDAKVRMTVVGGEVFEYLEEEKGKRGGRKPTGDAEDEKSETAADRDKPAEQADTQSETTDENTDRAQLESEKAKISQETGEQDPDAEVSGAGEGVGGSDRDESEEIQTADWAIETDASRIPSTKTRGNVLIRNATVITAINGTLENTSILVKDGRIVEIAPEITQPENCVLIDGTGAWVMPGIIDCHSHMVAGGNEGTLSVTPEVRTLDNMRSKDLTLFRAAAGGVTAANVLHGSANTIGGQRIVIRMKYGARPDDLLFPGFKPGIKFALGENVIRNENRYPNTRMGVESVLRLSFEEAQRYRQSWNRYNALSDADKARTMPPRRDLRLEALQQVLDGELLVHCHCYNSGEILMLLKTFTRFGIENLTLEHGLEAFKVAPEIVSFGKNGAYLSTFADFWGYKVEAYDAIPYNVAVLQKAGGYPILNSDSGERVRRLNHDAAKMVRWGGITYEQAIQTITLNPAKALQIDDQVGSIEIGKRADLALFNGHPLNTHARCFMTLIDGEVVFERGGERGGPFPLEPKSGFAASVPESSPSGVYAITNALVFPGSTPAIENGTVVITDGKVSAIGGAETIVPENATIVDGSNLQVHAGMIDGGSTVAVSDLGLSDAGEQGEIKPILQASSALKPDSPLIGIARFTGLTSSVTVPTGGLISGQSSIVQMDGWNFDELAFVDSLALEMSLPSKEIGGSSNRGRGRFRRPESGDQDETATPKPKLSPYDQIKLLFENTRRYDRVKQMAAEKGDPAPAYDEQLESMIPFVRGEKPIVVGVRTATDILDALDFAEDLEFKLILRDSGTESWKVAEQIADANVPVLLGPITASVRDSYEPYDSVYSIPAKLHEAGVLFAFYTNSDTSARDLPLSAGIAVAYGLPEDVALRALNGNTARIFGVDNIVGSLDVGKRADLIVTDRSPLQATSNVIHMFINGKPVDVDDNLHTDLYKKYMRRVEPREPATDSSANPAAGN